MCIPLVGTMVGAALSIAQMNAQAQAQYEQKQAANAQYTSNRYNAIQSANAKYASINTRAGQERHKAANKLFQTRLELMKKQATALTAAGEGGVTGLSVAALADDFVAQQARRESAIKSNFEYTLGSLNDEAIASYHDAVGQINSVRPGSPIPIVKPWYGGFGGAPYTQGNA